MNWKETKPGLYQRPLGALEILAIPPLSADITREPIRIHTFADLVSTTHNGKEIRLAFREAWKAMRLLTSPEIAATHQDGSKLYKVPTKEEEMEEWQSRTFLTAKPGTSITSVVCEMQLRLELFPVFYLIPQCSDNEPFKGSMILFISHWMTEASGAFQIINQLCDYASDLLKDDSSTRTALSRHVVGSEISLLTPALEDMMSPLKDSTLRAPSSKARVQAYFADFTAHRSVLDYTILSDSTATPSHMMQNQGIYSPSSTSALVNACKKVGISVTSAIHSAYLAAVWRYARPDRQSRPYASIMPAQMRKRLPTSSSYREQGCWNSAMLLILTAPVGQDFLTRARSLRQQYTKADDKVWQEEDMREMNEQTMKYFSDTPNQSDATPFITSMGLLDGDVIVSEHDSITVEKVSVWADSLGLGIVLGQWTFRGRLNIQISWNIAFHGEEQVQQTLDEIDSVLERELGVVMERESVRKMKF